MQMLGVLPPKSRIEVASLGLQVPRQCQGGEIDLFQMQMGQFKIQIKTKKRVHSGRDPELQSLERKPVVIHCMTALGQRVSVEITPEPGGQNEINIRIEGLV